MRIRLAQHQLRLAGLEIHGARVVAFHTMRYHSREGVDVDARIPDASPLTACERCAIRPPIDPILEVQYESTEMCISLRGNMRALILQEYSHWRAPKTWKRQEKARKDKSLARPLVCAEHSMHRGAPTLTYQKLPN